MMTLDELEALTKKMLSDLCGMGIDTPVKDMTYKILFDEDANKKILKIQYAKILFRDFSSNGTYSYGPTFCVRIDGRRAKKMQKDGWTIKYTEIKGKKIWFMPVSVYYRADNIAKLKPEVYLQIVDGKKNDISRLTTEGLRILDFATITCAHLEIHGYKWKITHPYEKTGVKAYLKTGIFGIDQGIDAKACLKTLNRGGFYG